MKNNLDEYDMNKFKKARQLILEIYEYNYISSTSLTKRLNTILNKMDDIINIEQTKIK